MLFNFSGLKRLAFHAQSRYVIEKTAIVMELSLIDTCFLMQERGRQRLLTSGMKVAVIASVRSELEKLVSLETPSRDALAARAFLDEHAERIEFLPMLPEERDVRKSLAAERPLQADAVFRRIAMRCAERQEPVHFLTADYALAEMLGLYADKITFLDRRSGQVGDWREVREARIAAARQSVSRVLCESDVVLTASGLRSPHLLQFLRNVQDVASGKSQLPVLHKLSRELLHEQGHLSLEVLDLLENGDVVRNDGCEVHYESETTMLDALYYARTSGRRITMVVSGWDAAVQRFDARTASHEHHADAVNFRVIAPAGELVPLLNAWRIRRFYGVSPVAFARAPEPAEFTSSAPASEPEPASPEITPEPVHLVSILSILKKDGPQLAQLVNAEKEELVLDAAARSENHRALAILFACRRGKVSLLDLLLQDAQELPGYCFENWFRKSARGPRYVSKSDLLLNDAYYKCLHQVLQHTRDLRAQSAAVTELQNFVKTGDAAVRERAAEVLKMLLACGVKVSIPAPREPKPKKEAPALSIKQVEQKYYQALIQLVSEEKSADLLKAIESLVRPVDLPNVLLLAIKAARRNDRPTNVGVLLKACQTLPAYCFENWFSRTAGNAKSPHSRDLLLRQSFFSCTRRIVELSPDLRGCKSAMLTLVNLAHDTDKTVSKRALAIIEQAKSKGATCPKLTPPAAAQA